MINNYLTGQEIKLNDLERDKKYDLILKFQTSDVCMKNLQPFEVLEEIDALTSNCATLKRPLNYSIIECTNSNQKTYKP
jgi:hypothetical protein